MRLSIILIFFIHLVVSTNAIQKGSWWDQFSHWLDKMSVQKPIKCNIEQDRFKQRIFAKIHPRPIRCFPCNTSFKEVEFSFKGKIQDQKLEGPGKLNFLIHDVVDKDIFMRKKGVCWQLGSLNRSHVRYIVGTWQNGYLTGPAKITMQSGEVIVADYQKGVLHGLKRSFYPNGDLETVTYHQNGTTMIGPSLLSHQDHFYQYLHEMKKHFPSTYLRIPRRQAHSEGYLGKGHGEFFIPTKLIKFSKSLEDVDSCFPKFEWSHELPVEKQPPLCEMEKNLEPGHRLEKIFSYITSPEDKLQWIENFRDFDEEPSEDCPKLISDIEINRDTLEIRAKIHDEEIANFIVVKDNFVNFDSLDGLGTFVTNASVTTADPTLGWATESITAHFMNGMPVGYAHITTKDGRHVVGKLRKGCFHGPVLLMGTAPVTPAPWTEREERFSFDGFGFLGFYKNGFAQGPFWLGTIGGGLIHGEINPKDYKISGNNISYLYPDYDTIFHGEFKDKIMIKAREAKLVSVKCHETGLPIIDQLSFPDFKNHHGDVVEYYFRPPSNVSFGGGPPDVIDPFERKNLILAPSSVPNSGDGVFVKKDVKSFNDSKLIALYSTLILTSDDQRATYERHCNMNKSRSDDDRRLCSKYSLNVCGGTATMEITPELDRPEVFQPSLGPKVNHHFTLNNTYYHCLDHPRFGLIGGVFLHPNRSLRKGQELFTFYGYEIGTFPFDHPWYHEFERELNQGLSGVDKESGDAKVEL